MIMSEKAQLYSVSQFDVNYYTSIHHLKANQMC